ncbi:MAG TPA: FliM/FliN family flagellar motor switch protein [Ensifer sp.]|nr:FliM/FliN family flagellar motor switch protein [Ensifer sp.]
MAEAIETTSPATLDPILLARMTGELGDAASLERICSELTAAYIEYLPDIFHSETGYKIEIRFGALKTGLKQELLAELGETVALCDAALRGWCPEFTMGCGSAFVMTLVEAMLGAPPELIEPPTERVLSKIELDLTEMIFSKVANVLRTAVATGGNFEPVLGNPYNAGDRPKPPEGYRDPNAVLISFIINLGKTESLIHIAVPQRNFLKTKVTTAKSTAAGRAKKEWTEQIKEQVERSQVAVEARINLQTQTLGIISKLQVGDVIPFQDLSDVKVQVNANGKELYFGEFGRSGARYTVRVTDTYSTETDLLEHLIS